MTDNDVESHSKVEGVGLVWEANGIIGVELSVRSRDVVGSKGQTYTFVGHETEGCTKMTASTVVEDRVGSGNLEPVNRTERSTDGHLFIYAVVVEARL